MSKTESMKKAIEVRDNYIGMLDMEIAMLKQLKSNTLYSRAQIVEMMSEITGQQRILVEGNDIATGISEEHQL